MRYSINPNCFKSTFAVPAALVDQHIRLANEHQLKVLLWILRNDPVQPDIAAMCQALKIDPADADDYLQYWVLTGVLLTDGAAPTPMQAPAPAATTPTPAPQPHAPPKPEKPTSAEIAARLEEAPELAELVREAQRMLGKTIGYNGLCTLLELHDHYGLPTEVLFMLIEYCVSVGKTNYSYLAAVGADWGAREIDTLERAAEQIEALRSANSLWSGIARAAGLKNPRPTPKQADFLHRWQSEWGFDEAMILLAYEEMAEHTGKLSFTYMDKVLQRWHNEGLSTPAAVKAAAQARHAAQQTAGQNAAQTASYDIDAFRDQSLHGSLQYKKKRKTDA
ncbi:MAG: DnaD domain protein [Clostridia bacterium]|nr:DnaD domain protein [Clostridia bacterium]